jgi:hypothetical protein
LEITLATPCRGGFAGDAGGLIGIGKYWLSEPKIAIRAMLRALRYDGARSEKPALHGWTWTPPRLYRRRLPKSSSGTV